MHWWKILGVAAFASVAATGVVVARDQRRRRAYTPEEIRARLHARLAAADERPTRSLRSAEYERLGSGLTAVRCGALPGVGVQALQRVGVNALHGSGREAAFEEPADSGCSHKDTNILSDASRHNRTRAARLRSR